LEKQLQDPTTQTSVVGKGKPPHLAIVKSMVMMGYRLDSIHEPLQTLIKPIMEEEIEEEMERQENKKKRRDDTSSYTRNPAVRANSSSSSPSNNSGNYSNNSSYRSYNTAFNNCPYKADSGLVGLKNQGATCYLNSLIQSLYMTPAFRRAVFQWRYDPQTDKPEKECIPLQLQRLFARLLLSEYRSVETTELTQSFGWDTKESFIQHDVQELLRVLFDALSSTTIPINALYQGNSRDYVVCQTCKYIGGRKDPFLDLQLVVRDVRHLNQAIENYQYEEMLSGENQYHCDHCNKRVDAKKGMKLLQLPDVLTFHLKRFDIDYTTFSRVKLNNEVIFPQTLDMNRHLKSSSDMKVSDIDSKHNIYNLYAILMHSGGATGGHYFAYIKNGDGWYEFNDSTVSKIDEKEIQDKAYGGGYGANAYMLMYSRQYPISDVHNEFSDMTFEKEIALIPEQIKLEIEKQNAEYLNGQREYEMKRDKAYCNIYFNNKKHEVAAPHTSTVGDLLKAAYDKIIKSDSCDISDTQLRLYDAQKKVPHEVLNQDSVLNTLVELSRYRMTLLLETKGKDETFLEYNSEEEYVVRVVKHIESSNFAPEKFVAIPKKCTLGQFRDIVSPKIGIGAEKMVVICQKYINTVKTEVIITDPYAQLRSEYGIEDGDIIYVEETNDSLSSDAQESVVAKLFDTQNNQIKLRYDAARGMDRPLVEQTLLIDRRRTVADLKAEIESTVGKSSNEFKLSLGRDENSYLLNDLDERLNQFPNNLKFWVHNGQQMSSGQYNITFYLLQSEQDRAEKRRKKKEEERKREEMYYRSYHDPYSTYSSRSGYDIDSNVMRHPHQHQMPHYGKQTRSKTREYNSIPRRVKWDDDEDNDGMYTYSYSRSSSSRTSKLLEEVLQKTQTVRDIKKHLSDLSKEKGDVQAYYSPDRLRLREKLHGRNYPGRVLLDDEQPFISLASSTVSAVPNREIIIEPLEEAEQFSPDDMIIRVARWYPSKWKIGPIHELIVGRDNTVEELRKLVLCFFNVTERKNPVVDDTLLKLKKIPYQIISQLRDNDFMFNMDWNDKNLKDDSIISKEPLYLVDADLILYKDETEPDWFTLNNKLDIIAPKRTKYGNGDATVGERVDGAGGSDAVKATNGGIGTTTLSGKSSYFDRREQALRFYTKSDSKKEDGDKSNQAAAAAVVTSSEAIALEKSSADQTEESSITTDIKPQAEQ
jgi:ubiquitin C-terminal hydrolase